MKTIVVNRFDNGMQESQYSRIEGGCSVCKHFDAHTYPFRLRPYRGVEADTTGQTSIGNLLVGSNGLVYGLGSNGSANRIYYKSTAITDAWAALANSTNGGTALGYELFVEYRDYNAVKRIFFGSYRASDTSTAIYMADITGATGITSHNLTFTTLGQGIRHPKDDVLYIPYDNKIARYNPTEATESNNWTDAALTLPAAETITSIAPYGNYLAIATVPTNAISGIATTGTFKSKVYLWDRDVSLGTVSEVIDWDTGLLRIINELDGVLIGVSDTKGASAVSPDFDSLLVKAYTGVFPQLLKEITTRKQTTTAPDAVVNSRVNFISGGKLYFSANIVGGSTSPKQYGLWTVAKSKVSGRYAVTIEAGATNDNTETGVLAAVKVGDYFNFVHTAAGTVTRSYNTTSDADAFNQTSFYESLVNPNMSDVDYMAKKQLKSVTCHYLPLPAAGDTITNFITFKYRVDGGDWISVFTESTQGAVATERVKTATDEFTSGRQYEFRIESTGGAEILGFSYKYEILETNI